MNIAKVVSNWAKGAVVVCALAVLVPVVAMAQPEWKDVVLKNGIRFGLAATAPTVEFYVRDPITGSIDLKTEELGRMPVTVDGERIYTIREVKTDKPVSEVLNYLKIYMINKLQEAKLPDGKGSFYMHNIVVDKYGKIIYCDIEMLKLEEKDGSIRTINQSGYDSIIKDAPSIVAQVSGKPVYAILDSTGRGRVPFIISKGQVSLAKTKY